jgi:hypothetical protein
MRFPDDDGLPLWLFILVFIISIVSLALVLFVVWRKCLKRSSGLGVLSFGVIEPPDRKMSVRKGQTVRSSSKISLTGPKFGVGASHHQSRCPSSRWPETAYVDGSHENVHKSGNRHSFANAPSSGDHSASAIRRWPDFVRGLRTTDLKTPVDFPADEENLRASYTSDSGGLVRTLDEEHPKLKWSNIEPLTLNSPAPLSPITPLTLPRTPRSTHLSLVKLKRISRLAAVPPLKPHRVPRYREEIASTCSTKQTDARKLESRFSRSHYGGHSQSREYRSSAATSTSFLQAWSGAYHDWLVHPERPSGNSSTTSDVPRPSHIGDLVPVTNPSLKSEDEYGRDVSLPSQTPISFNGSISPVSHALSSETTSIRSEREKSGEVSGRMIQVRETEISWLVDD